jgi:hypothetical protein
MDNKISRPSSKPGLENLNKYLRKITEEEMEHDSKAFIDFIRDKHLGETIILLGTGPSVNTIDLSVLDNFTTIGANGIGLVYYPDYYVICDPFIYGLYKDVFLASSKTKILSSFTRGEYDVRIYWWRENEIGLSKHTIYHADNTGYIILSIAYIMGAQNVILVGYDGYNPKDSKFHCYDEKKVEFDRVLYEWVGEAGIKKQEMMLKAFKYATKKFLDEGKGLYLLTESYLLGDLIDKISIDELLKMEGENE